MRNILEFLGVVKNTSASEFEKGSAEKISNTSEFEWVTKQWVKSQKGFEVKTLNRYAMEYSESNGMVLKIKSDIGFTNNMEPCLIVSPNAFSGAGIREQEVKNNFVEAMKFQTMVVSFE